MSTKVSDHQLEVLAAESHSVAEILRKLGRTPVGGSNTWLSRRLRKAGIDTSHFTGQGWNKGGQSVNRLSADDILILHPKGCNRPAAFRLRRALLEIGRELKCTLCPITDTWNDKPIVLEIDHINRMYWDDRRENLRFLCPNCHAQETQP